MANLRSYEHTLDKWHIPELEEEYEYAQQFEYLHLSEPITLKLEKRLENAYDWPANHNVLQPIFNRSARKNNRVLGKFQNTNAYRPRRRRYSRSSSNQIARRLWVVEEKIHFFRTT